MLCLPQATSIADEAIVSSHCFTSQRPSRCPFGGLRAQGSLRHVMRKMSFQTCFLLLKLVYEVPRILLAGDRIDDDACNIALGAIAALRCLPVAAYLPSPAFGACRELRRLGRHAFTYRAMREVITKLFAYARDGTEWRGNLSDIAEVNKLGLARLVTRTSSAKHDIYQAASTHVCSYP